MAFAFHILERLQRDPGSYSARLLGGGRKLRYPLHFVSEFDYHFEHRRILGVNRSRSDNRNRGRDTGHGVVLDKLADLVGYHRLFNVGALRESDGICRGQGQGRVNFVAYVVNLLLRPYLRIDERGGFKASDGGMIPNDRERGHVVLDLALFQEVVFDELPFFFPDYIPKNAISAPREWRGRKSLRYRRNLLSFVF